HLTLSDGGRCGVVRASYGAPRLSLRRAVDRSPTYTPVHRLLSGAPDTGDASCAVDVGAAVGLAPSPHANGALVGTCLVDEPCMAPAVLFVTGDPANFALRRGP